MIWNPEKYHQAIFEWLEAQRKKRKIHKSNWWLKLKLEGSLKGRGKLRRQAEKGLRQWKIEDICKIAEYLKQDPSEILAQVELHYKHFLEFPQKNRKNRAN